MSTLEADIPRPNIVLALLESRAFFEAGASVISKPIFSSFPQGDGHPVMVLPGFATGDLATKSLRAFIQNRGYRVYPWSNGINFGNTRELRDKLHTEIAEIVSRHGRAISLVGWSLGGIIAPVLWAGA